ncbi:hypothetical protein KQI61_15400 [Anaerocolumna aminovalerica]|uniref:hypothetical protein n=1 Tax=Anaerocolumna aminovalerica TaxID=1527 RepID=UPI001C0F28C5|nr:hypothetical protein [Anaerocolumna aminovalerica]MBU5333584.1 hypothetical protein [Anaerocolumna aminovalerica]
MLYLVCYTYLKRKKDDQISKKYIVYAVNEKKAIDKVNSIVNTYSYYGYYLEKIKVEEYINKYKSRRKVI